MKNATNIENTIIVAFLLLEYNIKVDERERMWSKVLIKNLKIDTIIVIKKKEVILLITENNNLEFKRELTDSIVKEIIAFCNTTGGTIILGYNDNGKVVGLKNAKEDLDRLSSKINDSIEPSVNFLVSSRIEREDNKEIIVVEVLKGTNKPYYIKSKGMTIDGVFVRLGAPVSLFSIVNKAHCQKKDLVNALMGQKNSNQKAFIWVRQNKGNDSRVIRNFIRKEY